MSVENYYDLPSARQIVDLQENIVIVNPNETPFLALMRGVKWETAIQPKFGISNHADASRLDAINQANGTAGYAYTATDTSIVVDDASKFHVDDIIRFTAYDELAQVTARNTTTNTLTIVRGVAGTTAHTLADNDVILIQGGARASGTISADDYATTDEYWNYTQMFWRAFELDFFAKNSQTLPGQSVANEIKLQRLASLREHKKDIEYAMLFGEPQAGSSTADYMTAGLMHYVSAETTGTYTLSTMTADDLVAFVRSKAFKYYGRGDKKKVMLCGGDLYDRLTSIFMDKLRLAQSSDYWGIDMQIIRLGAWQLGLVYHPLMEDKYAKDGIIYDPMEVQIKAFRKTQLWKGIQARNSTNEEDAYFTVAGLDVESPKTIAYLDGS